MPRKDAGPKDVHVHSQIVNGAGYSVQCAACKTRGPAFHPLLPPATTDGIEQRTLFDDSPPEPPPPFPPVLLHPLSEAAPPPYVHPIELSSKLAKSGQNR